jgi:hypothetical protein
MQTNRREEEAGVHGTAYLDDPQLEALRILCEVAENVINEPLIEPTWPDYKP